VPRLLLINPNTTAEVTTLAACHVRATVGADFEVVTATAAFGCAYIASEACYAIAGHAALECFAAHGEGCDAVLLACFGDPGLFALREVSAVPVVGLAEASMQAAAERGGRFAIVTGGERWKPILERFAAMLGYRDRLAAVRAIALTGGEIAADPEPAVALLADACAAAADEDGADEVILGGAGLAGLAGRIQPRVWVPVFDSVIVGAQRAAVACRAREERPGASSGPSAALGRLLT
jgi:Asp/Glu/hydantoin racemase